MGTNITSMELDTIASLQEPGPSVEIRRAYKSYSDDIIVLQGLNMTVPIGEIYALLGSSGSGKSTLLSCILGQRKLDSGSIKLSVDLRSDIGFMPQDISLCKELNIFENMTIFGYLYGMERDEIITRGGELIELLQLPSGDKYLGKLSAGEQRRVSLAIALLHNPNIIILDEPTVGVDVKLGQIIWDYLQQMAVSGKTIIITTHYIQEAHRANTIGILRHGVLIAEENPRSLMINKGSDNLEDIFLSLSEEQQAEENRPSQADGLVERHSRAWGLDQNSPSERSSSMTKPFFIDDKKNISARRLKSVLYKNIVQLIRNYAFLLTVMILPIMQVLVYHYVYGRFPKELKIGIVNDEISMRDCNYAAYSKCVLSDENFYLSCVFVDLFRNRTYKMIEYSDEISAVRAVNENAIWAAVHFAKNYTKSVIEFFKSNKTENLTNRIGFNSWVDSSDNFISTLVEQEVRECYQTHRAIALGQCNSSSRLFDYPGNVLFEPPLNTAGDRDSAFLSSVVPSVLMLLSFCLASTAAAMIGIEEKVAGTIVRMQAGGLSLCEFMISIFIVQVVLHIVRVFSSLILMYWIMGYTLRGDLITLVLLMTSIGVLGILSGILSTVLTINPTVTMIAQNGLIYLVAYSTGVIWPLEAQHSILRTINYFLPFTWSVSAAHGVALRNLPVTNEIVLEAFGVIYVWIIISSSMVGYILKYRANALISKG